MSLPSSDRWIQHVKSTVNQSNPDAQTSYGRHCESCRTKDTEIESLKRKVRSSEHMHGVTQRSNLELHKRLGEYIHAQPRRYAPESDAEIICEGEERDECPICFEPLFADTMCVLPCHPGHVLCKVCRSKLQRQKCPYCRKKI